MRIHQTSVAAVVDELRKIADIKTPLLPHQQRVVDRISQEDQPGLVVAHGLGSGKTLTSIAAQDKLNLPSTVVVPAALKQNYQKERTKHLTGKTPKATIQSQQQRARNPNQGVEPMLIVDEAHRLRDAATKNYQALKNTDAQKRLLLTASPFYNHPSDIAPLVNIAAGESVLPMSKDDFSAKYVSQQKVWPGLMNYMRGADYGVREGVNPKRSDELKGIFGKWVDQHPSSTEGFPTVEREDVSVPMTSQQLRVYDSLMNKAPPWVAAKVRAGLPPSKKESTQLNGFLSAARQIANSTSPFQTEGEAHDPKIQRAFEEMQKHLQDPQGKGVVYSNYLDAGIQPYKSRLEQAGIPYGEFTGALDRKKRDQLVSDYNENKLKVLLLSSAGGEGLDLKGTRLLQMLEPHWNEEKLRQVEGRGIRYKSHEGLPTDQQNVRVQRFLATRPASGILESLKLRKPGHSVDEYLAQRGRDKQDLIDAFKKLLPNDSPQPV